MNTKLVAWLCAALASASVFAQTRHHRDVMFGDEIVTIKFTPMPASPEWEKLWDDTEKASDPVERERLWRIRWEDYGESIALQALANYHLERGDLVSAYAHFYAVDKIARWYEDVAPKKPGPIVLKIHAGMAADVERVGSRLTGAQRRAGVRLAAELIRNSPNCCDPI